MTLCETVKYAKVCHNQPCYADFLKVDNSKRFRDEGKYLKCWTISYYSVHQKKTQYFRILDRQHFFKDISKEDLHVLL